MFKQKKNILSDDHPDTIKSMINLAMLYKNEGKYDKAEPLYLECLEKRKRILGEDHPDTLGSMNTLAILYDKQERYDKAEPLYLECLDKRKIRLDKDHPDTLISMNTLAKLYDKQGRYDKAEPLYLECLEKSKRVLGEDHPDTLISMNTLAMLYDNQGKYDKAEPFYLECLEKSKRVLGEDHPDTLISMNNLAKLYDKQGRYDKAEPLYLECLDKRKIRLDKDHPDTLISMNILAKLYDKQGRYDKAEPLYLECLEKRKIRLGENHPDTLISMNTLAKLYDKQGRYDKAELYLEYTVLGNDDCISKEPRLLCNLETKEEEDAIYNNNITYKDIIVYKNDWHDEQSNILQFFKPELNEKRSGIKYLDQFYKINQMKMRKYVKIDLEEYDENISQNIICKYNNNKQKHSGEILFQNYDKLWNLISRKNMNDEYKIEFERNVLESDKNFSFEEFCSKSESSYGIYGKWYYDNDEYVEDTVEDDCIVRKKLFYSSIDRKKMNDEYIIEFERNVLESDKNFSFEEFCSKSDDGNFDWDINHHLNDVELPLREENVMGESDESYVIPILTRKNQVRRLKKLVNKMSCYDKSERLAYLQLFTYNLRKSEERFNDILIGKDIITYKDHLLNPDYEEIGIEWNDKKTIDKIVYVIKSYILELHQNTLIQEFPIKNELASNEVIYPKIFYDKIDKMVKRYNMVKDCIMDDCVVCYNNTKSKTKCCRQMLCKICFTTMKRRNHINCPICRHNNVKIDNVKYHNFKYNKVSHKRSKYYMHYDKFLASMNKNESEFNDLLFGSSFDLTKIIKIDPINLSKLRKNDIIERNKINNQLNSINISKCQDISRFKGIKPSNNFKLFNSTYLKNTVDKLIQETNKNKNCKDSNNSCFHNIDDSSISEYVILNNRRYIKNMKIDLINLSKLRKNDIIVRNKINNQLQCIKYNIEFITNVDTDNSTDDEDDDDDDDDDDDKINNQLNKIIQYPNQVLTKRLLLPPIYSSNSNSSTTSNSSSDYKNNNQTNVLTTKKLLLTPLSDISVNTINSFARSNSKIILKPLSKSLM